MGKFQVEIAKCSAKRKSLEVISLVYNAKTTSKKRDAVKKS